MEPTKTTAERSFHTDRTTVPNIILPFNPKRTTAQDIAALTWHLARLDPDVRLLPFASTTPPVEMSQPFSPSTATFTLNNYHGAPAFDAVPGPKFFPPRMSKTQIAQAIVAAGIPVPHTAQFAADSAPDPAKFGAAIAIKSMAPSAVRGRGIHVFKTADFNTLRETLLTRYDAEIAAGTPPLLQQYVNTGPAPVSTRVTSFLGAPIVCFQTIAPAPFSLSQMSGLAGAEATSNASDNRTRVLVNDPEMLEISAKICAAFPTAAVVSADLVRCVDSGKVYCVEATMGNLCVLSAPLCAGLRQALGEDRMHRQFDSYGTMARRMIANLPQP